ncbi:lysosomal membrane ascorbate-dependent ferrireductase CYB561A3 [Brachionichthys hirsutus]|uniref:lysosomal membrane ascorbate-dependent ferrireductase CYB561A3 n=1 Tax=Brachionichthys hirsutus TaxID=412623 RepID=UPI0036044C42
MSKQQVQWAALPSPTPDLLPLCVLIATEPGSGPSAEPEKQEVKQEVVVNAPEPPDRSRMSSALSFGVLYLLALVLGLACVGGVCFWSSHWHGGFAWGGSALQFNWHPVLMVTGLVVLYGCGAVVYRIPLTWGQDKLPWKRLHAALMLLALVLSIVGLRAVFEVHDAENIPKLYSLHSWIGITTAALFATQWVVGVAGFLLPCSPMALRRLLKPAHVLLGGSIVTLSVAASVSGINEKLIFALGKGPPPRYKDLPPEAVFGNSLGVLIVAFGVLVFLMLSNPKWQRPDSAPERTYSPLLQDESE